MSWSTSWKLPSDSISESKVDGGTSTSITSSIPAAAKDLGAIAEKQSVKARVRERTSNFPKSVDTKLEPKWPGNMIPTTHCLLSASSTQVQNIYIHKHILYIWSQKVPCWKSVWRAPKRHLCYFLRISFPWPFPPSISSISSVLRIGSTLS